MKNLTLGILISFVLCTTAAIYGEPSPTPTATPASKAETTIRKAHSNVVNNREAASPTPTATPKTSEKAETTIRKGHSNVINNREAASPTATATPKP